jgi:hypothetical protein
MMQVEIGARYRALAEDLAKLALDDNRSAFEQMRSNWKIARASGDISVALVARGSVFDWMAAAAMLGRPIDLQAGAQAAVQWGCELGECFQPAPELLLVELSLSLAMADSHACHRLAQSVVRHTPSDNLYNLERGQSQALASLIVNDFEAARQHAGRLRQASQSGELDKQDSQEARCWADIFDRLVVKDLNGCAEALRASNAARTRYVDRELGRLLRGRDTDITVFEMIDWPGAAILHLLREFGVNSDAGQ